MVLGRGNEVEKLNGICFFAEFIMTLIFYGGEISLKFLGQ